MEPIEFSEKQSNPRKFTYRLGDLLEAFEAGEVTVLAHQTNCRGVMGSGIAAAIAAKYPRVAEIDSMLCNSLDMRGRMAIAEQFDSGSKFIANLYGQYLPGRNTDYGLLENALYELNSALTQMRNPNHIVGMPLIGCGVGGGDWGVVSMLIEKTIDAAPVVVYIMDERIFEKVTSP